MGDKVRAKVRSYTIHPGKMSKLQCAHPAVLTFSTLFSVEQPSIAEENKPQRTQRGKAATEAASATAEYAKYAKAGREPLFLPFPRIWRIPRFNRHLCPGEFHRSLRTISTIAVQRTQRKKPMKDIKELCAQVRQISYDIHVYHGHGHLEKV